MPKFCWSQFIVEEPKERPPPPPPGRKRRCPRPPRQDMETMSCEECDDKGKRGIFPYSRIMKKRGRKVSQLIIVCAGFVVSFIIPTSHWLCGCHLTVSCQFTVQKVSSWISKLIQGKTDPTSAHSQTANFFEYWPCL